VLRQPFELLSAATASLPCLAWAAGDWTGRCVMRLPLLPPLLRSSAGALVWL
jgi:hypothetical protein